MRVLYVQYTNPGAYPPLVRGAQLLAAAGAEVRMLGVEIPGTEALVAPADGRVVVELQGAAGTGWRLKAHYARYATWVVHEARRWRPDWIYASDLYSAPVALPAIGVTGARVVYHEHDAPSGEHDSWFVRRCLAARRELARRATLLVVPNAERARRFSREVAGGRPVVTAWNCPRRADARPPRGRTDDAFRLIYRGSVNAQRLPLTVVDAMARLPGRVSLDVAGYETAGSRGFLGALVAHAERLGVGRRLRALGGVAEGPLLDLSEQCDVGLALMPTATGDENMRHMLGASNKVFEYMACGVVPLLTDLPEWRTGLIDHGLALACDPADPESIANALAWAMDHRSALREMAERGRTRVLSDWNYETQFAPVLDAIVGPGARCRVEPPEREAACAS